MTVDKKDKYEFDNVKWVYIKNEKDATVLELQNDVWMLFHKGMSYSGTFEEIAKQCEKIVGSDFFDEYEIK